MNRMNRWMASALVLGCVSCLLASGCSAETGAPGDTGATEPVGGDSVADTSPQAGASVVVDGGQAATGAPHVLYRVHAVSGLM
jgi:hypothetical protein